MITVGFSTTTKWMSRVIRWVTRAPCSHAWVSFYDETLGLQMVMQAEWWGFEVRPRDRWVRENILVSEFDFPDLDLSPALKIMAHELGGDYDYGSAFWVGVKGWLRRWFGAKLTLRPGSTPHQLMCSEAVGRLLEHAGYTFQTGTNLELMSPGDLRENLLRSSRARLIHQ